MPTEVSVLPRGHSEVGDQGQDLGSLSGSFYLPKTQLSRIESWLYVALNTCSAVAFAPAGGGEYGAHRGSWLENGGLGPSRQAGISSLAPLDLLDAHFDTCLNPLFILDSSVLNP